MNIIITGLITGSMLALLAIGFSLIFGVARIVNIAHTAFYMVAAYCIYYLTSKFGLNPVVGMLIAVAAVTVLGLLAYKFLIDPIREHEAAVLIATIALAMIFQEAMLLIFTGDYLSVSSLIEGYFIVLGVKVFYQQVLTFGVVLLILAAPLVLADEDQIGPGHPFHGRGPGGGQSDGDEREPAGHDHDGHLGRAGRLYRGGDCAPDRLEPLHVDGTLIMMMAVVVLGGLGSIKGSFVGGLYPGIYRSPGGFPDPQRRFSERIGRLVDHDPGPADTAGRPLRHFL